MNLASDATADVNWTSSPMSPRTSVEEVLSRVKAMVHVGELGPGDRLPPERLLCEMLNVSRSTLREGLRALRTEGYIEVRRGSSGGNFITPLNEPYARWLRTMRENPTRLQRDHRRAQGRRVRGGPHRRRASDAGYAGSAPGGDRQGSRDVDSPRVP